MYVKVRRYERVVLEVSHDGGRKGSDYGTTLIHNVYVSYDNISRNTYRVVAFADKSNLTLLLKWYDVNNKACIVYMYATCLHEVDGLIYIYAIWCLV